MAKTETIRRSMAVRKIIFRTKNYPGARTDFRRNPPYLRLPPRYFFAARSSTPALRLCLAVPAVQQPRTNRIMTPLLIGLFAIAAVASAPVAPAHTGVARQPAASIVNFTET